MFEYILNLLGFNSHVLADRQIILVDVRKTEPLELILLCYFLFFRSRKLYFLRLVTILSELGTFEGKYWDFAISFWSYRVHFPLKRGNFFDFLGKVGGFELLMTLKVKSLTTKFYVLYLYFLTFYTASGSEIVP